MLRGGKNASRDAKNWMYLDEVVSVIFPTGYDARGKVSKTEKLCRSRLTAPAIQGKE